MNRMFSSTGARRVAALVSAAATLAGAGYALGAPTVALAAPASIFVYNGNSSTDEGYTKFGTAAGRPVSSSATLPADLSPYACVVLPVNAAAFSAGQITTFSTYVNGGGTLIALGENAGFAAANTNLTAVSTGLGAGMTVVGDTLSGPTTNIVASPLTAGMTSFGYTAAGHVTISAPGQPLIYNLGAGTQPAIVGTAVLGAGLFVLSGDSNAFSDNDIGSYTLNSNPILVANLCAPRSTQTTVTCPNPTVGQATTCTATVTDSDAAGHKTAPSGTETFSTSGQGTFGSGGTCTLAATSTPGQSSCSVPFTPTAAGTQNVSAAFAGDVRHTSSNGQVAAAVVAVVPNLPKAGAPTAGSVRADRAAELAIALLVGVALATGGAFWAVGRLRRRSAA
jgi:hypothetical protein